MKALEVTFTKLKQKSYNIHSMLTTRPAKFNMWCLLATNYYGAPWCLSKFLSRHAGGNTLSLSHVVVHLFNLKSSLPLCDPTLVSAPPCSDLLVCTDAWGMVRCTGAATMCAGAIFLSQGLLGYNEALVALDYTCYQRYTPCWHALAWWQTWKNIAVNDVTMLNYKVGKIVAAIQKHFSTG